MPMKDENKKKFLQFIKNKEDEGVNLKRVGRISVSIQSDRTETIFNRTETILKLGKLGKWYNLERFDLYLSPTKRYFGTVFIDFHISNSKIIIAFIDIDDLINIETTDTTEDFICKLLVHKRINFNTYNVDSVNKAFKKALKKAKKLIKRY